MSQATIREMDVIKFLNNKTSGYYEMDQGWHTSRFCQESQFHDIVLHPDST